MLDVLWTNANSLAKYKVAIKKKNSMKRLEVKSISF